MKCGTFVGLFLSLIFSFSFNVEAAPKKIKKDKETKVPKVTIQKVAYKKRGMKEFKKFKGKEAEPVEVSLLPVSSSTSTSTSPSTSTSTSTSTTSTTTTSSTSDPLYYSEEFQGIYLPEESFQVRLVHNSDVEEMLFTGIEGDPEFKVIENTCNYSKSCYTLVEFTASTEGFKKATIYSTLYSNGEPVYYLGFGMTAYVLEQGLPPECNVYAIGSIIKIDEKSVSERVPVVGVPFELFYSSDHSKDFEPIYSNASRVNSFNPEGWTISILHHLNTEEKNLFLGSGKLLKRTPKPDSSGNLLVVNGDEVYVFDPSGKHLATKSILTGFTRYSFSYTTDNKINKITDAYGKETVFTRNLNGGLESIVGPYGQVTQIGLDVEGRINSITNPLSQSYHITYEVGEDPEDFIHTFTKPSGIQTEFLFEDGFLVSDEGNGGNGWEIVYGIEGTALKTELKSELDRNTVYITDVNLDTGMYYRTETKPYGLVTTFSEGPDRSHQMSNPFESSIKTTQSDERFGDAHKRDATYSETVSGVTRLTEYLQSVTLSDPNDPFSYSEILNTVKVNGVATTNKFVKSTMTSTITSPTGVQTFVQLD